MFDNSITKAFETLQRLTKAIKKGTFTDEMFPLLELQLKYTEEFILEEIATLKSTQTAIAPEPQIVDISTDETIIKFLQDIQKSLK